MDCKPLRYVTEIEAFRLVVHDRLLLYDHGDVGRASHVSTRSNALKRLG